MALLEAAAADCVCIATDVGNARDLRDAGRAVVLLPSPLGELEAVTQQQFLAAAMASLPEHRANVADALRDAWRDYGSLTAAAAESPAPLEPPPQRPIDDSPFGPREEPNMPASDVQFFQLLRARREEAPYDPYRIPDGPPPLHWWGD